MWLIFLKIIITHKLQAVALYMLSNRRCSTYYVTTSLETKKSITIKKIL